MELTIEQLKLFTKCPLLLEQYTLYQSETLVSRSIREGVLSTVFQVLYQKMRGRKPSHRAIADSWRAVGRDIERRFPDISRESFDFPAQCLAVFLEHYLPKSNKDEIIGVNVPLTMTAGDHTICGSFHVLSRTPYGTRITLFEMTPDRRPPLWIENDVFLSVYCLAYQEEFGKDPLCINIHNLGDGSFRSIIRKPETLDGHKKKLAMLAELCYNKYSFPNDHACGCCEIAAPCHITRYAK
jgi:hypothetical protein